MWYLIPAGSTFGIFLLPHYWGIDLLISWPYYRPSDTELKFDTYRFYLHSISQFFIDKYTNLENFIDICYQKTSNLQGYINFDPNCIEPLLKLSWNTEYLINSDTDNINLIRFGNQWKSIQTYYAVYSSGEVVAYLFSKNRFCHHQSTLKILTNYFYTAGLQPWCFCYYGCIGKTKNAQQPKNFPSGIIVPNNLKRINVDPIQSIAKCLKAEHHHRVDDLWKRENGYKYQFNPGFTSILHFLYRLRIKSNYKEVDLFISRSSDEHILQFANGLKDICQWTLTYLEIIIARKCKKKFLLDCIDKYLQLNGEDFLLLKRQELYRRLIR